MKNLLRQLACEDSGQDLVEYCFLAIFIAFAVTLGLQAISSGLNTGFSNLGAQLGSGS